MNATLVILSCSILIGILALLSQGNTCWYTEPLSPSVGRYEVCLNAMSSSWPCCLNTWGSDSWRWLLSVSRGRTSLSGFADMIGLAARQPVSLSGGGQRLITVSETNGLLAPCVCKQPPSVSLSAGAGGGTVLGARPPLSAVL